MTKHILIALTISLLTLAMTIPAYSGVLDGKAYVGKNGRITYSGFVKDDDLEATFIWFDKGKYGQPEQVKWWKGRKK